MWDNFGGKPTLHCFDHFRSAEREYIHGYYDCELHSGWRASPNYDGSANGDGNGADYKRFDIRSGYALPASGYARTHRNVWRPDHGGGSYA